MLNCGMSSTRLNSVVEILTTVIDVADISSAGRQKLVALVQSRRSSNNDGNEFSEHDSDIIDESTDLL